KRWVKNSIIPTRVIGSTNIHIGAIIGHDDTVSLHRTKYFPDVWIASTLIDIDTGLQSQTRAHWQRAYCRTGSMRSGIHVPVGRTHRDPKRMANFWQIRIIDLVVTNQARQNRQPSSVCRSPSVGPTVVRVHIKEGTRAGEPFRLSGTVVNIEKLVQLVAVSI